MTEQRLVPHNVEAEESVLGSVLIDPIVIDRLRWLGPREFFIIKNQWLWSSMLMMTSRGEAIDFLTLCNELERRGQLAEIGGAAYISHLINVVPTAIHVNDYAKIVREKFKRRTWLAAASDIAILAYDENKPIDDVEMRLLQAFKSSTDDERFEYFWADEAMEPQPPVEWIVDKVISRASSNIWAGEAGSKKTWSLLDCCVSVATGKPWIGYATVKAPCLIIDEESGPRRLKRRLGDCLRGHNATGQVDIACISMALTNLRERMDQIEIERVIKKTGAGLVVIDALIDVMPGADDNLAKDTQPVFHAVRAMAEDTNSAIVMIHHHNKTGSFRGSSAIKGAVDTLINVKSQRQNTKIEFSMEKSRDGQEFDFAAMGNWGEGTFCLSASTPDEHQEHFSKSERFVLDYLDINGPKPVKTIINAADTCTPEAARRSIYSLTARGKVKRIDGGASGESAVYAMSSWEAQEPIPI